MDAAAELEELYRAIYLRLCARRSRRRTTAQTVAVLQHLARTGPLTVGEAAAHFERAQSVVSEMFEQMERRGLLARMRDERDRRRSLVWLTDDGRELLRSIDEVLSQELTARALARMSARDRQSLFTGLRALVRAADAQNSTHHKRRTT
jgi:DNA-binding MarR family transcriptional regulator